MKNLYELKKKGLCVGCGLCSSSLGKNYISMENIGKEGLRPSFSKKYIKEKRKDIDNLKLCPGNNQTINEINEKAFFDHGFGQYLEIWEGYASDPDIRKKGSSGGIITALSIMCLDSKEYEKVIHTQRHNDISWQNKTTISEDRENLLKTTGSRYAPSSPCDVLNKIGKQEKVVFVGKPCDCGGYRNWEREKGISDNLVLGFFCAGVPSEKGMLELIKKQGIDPVAIDKMDYRSEGWPGKFQLYSKNIKVYETTYLDSWSFLQPYRHFRCHLCPDGFAEQADISTGDAWHRLEEEPSEGKSIIIIRTELGRKILKEAMEKEYLTCTPSSAENVSKGQGLTKRRKMIWGRYLILKLFLLPTPKYKGYRLWDSWKKLEFKDKVHTHTSTLSRIVKRRFIVSRSLNRK